MTVSDEFRSSMRAAIVNGIKQVGQSLAGGRDYDDSLWDKLADQMALRALLVPESAGGQGATIAEAAVVAEEFGRHLIPSPIVGIVGATIAADSVPSSNVYNRICGALSGGESATVAVGERGGSWLSGKIATVCDVEHVGDSAGEFYGEKIDVERDRVPTLIVVSACDRGEQRQDRLVLACIDAQSPNVTWNDLSYPDRCRRRWSVSFNGVVEGVFARLPKPMALDRSSVAATLALCAEMVGGATSCYEEALEYSKSRHTFGRPISANQSIKHQLAQATMDLEAVRALLWESVRAFVGDDPAVSSLVSLLKASAGEMYREIARLNMKIHGGMGFTWELGAHWHLRKAVANESYWGSPDDHLSMVAEKRLGYGRIKASGETEYGKSEVEASG